MPPGVAGDADDDDPTLRLQLLEHGLLLGQFRFQLLGVARALLEGQLVVDGVFVQREQRLAQIRDRGTKPRPLPGRGLVRGETPRVDARPALAQCTTRLKRYVTSFGFRNFTPGMSWHSAASCSIHGRMHGHPVGVIRVETAADVGRQPPLVGLVDRPGERLEQVARYIAETCLRPGRGLWFDHAVRLSCFILSG